MNNNKLAGFLAAGLIGIPVVAGLIGNGDGDHPGGGVKDQPAVAESGATGDASQDEIASTETDETDVKTEDATGAESETAATEAEVASGDESGESDTAEASAPETDSAEPEAAEAMSAESEATGTETVSGDESGDTETAEASGDGEAASTGASEDISADVEATEMASAETQEIEPKFEDTNGEAVSASETEESEPVDLAMTLEPPSATEGTASAVPVPNADPEDTASAGGRVIAGFDGLTTGCFLCRSADDAGRSGVVTT